MALVAVEVFQAHVEGAAAVAGERDVKFKRLLTVLASEEPEQGDAERLELEELVFARMGQCRLLSAFVGGRSLAAAFWTCLLYMNVIEANVGGMSAKCRRPRGENGAI